MFTLRLIIILLICLLPMPSFGYDIKDMEQKIQSGQLPGWCYYTQSHKGWGSKRSKAYLKKFGKDWMHMHHYCWGLDKINLALEEGIQSEHYRSKIYSAVKEFDYALNRVKSKNLQLSVLMQKGKAYMYLNKHMEAIQVFDTIINADKSKVFSYVLKGQAYKNIGNKSKAIETFREGLEYNPDSDLLKKELKKIN